MADTERLNEAVALLYERDEEFRIFENGKTSHEGGEPIWSLNDLKDRLGYASDESIDKAVTKAKVVAGKANISIKENFIDGEQVGHPGDKFVTKYAALLVVMHADENKMNVALAKSYFAHEVDRQQIENEKRLKARLDVANENHKLTGVARQAGVEDFQKFNGVGVAALYGGKTVRQIQVMKGLRPSEQYLDFAGSEELAANLFRITQTAAALKRQEERSELKACETHRRVADGVRKAIIQAGNTPPERLPKAEEKIDKVATKVKKELRT